MLIERTDLHHGLPAAQRTVARKIGEKRERVRTDAHQPDTKQRTTSSSPHPAPVPAMTIRCERIHR